MAEFVMPQLGADMSAGKLLAWRKSIGDKVSRGDIIADVETDKADIEVEVFATGVVEKLLVQPGEKVPVGTPLAIIREEGKPAAPEAPQPPRAAAVEPAPWWRRSPFHRMPPLHPVTSNRSDEPASCRPPHPAGSDAARRRRGALRR